MTTLIRQQLVDFGLSSKSSFELYSEGVRDRADIRVFRCSKSHVIVLDLNETDISKTYEQKSEFEYWNNQGSSFSAVNEDDKRRAKSLKEQIAGKKVLDFGCGMGGFLFEAKPSAQLVHGLELQSSPRKYLNENGIVCYKDLNELKDEFYDVITMFHVYEHLEDPIGITNALLKKLKPNGQLLVEVPHAKDALLSVFESEAFKKFTLWSEHLILHTKASLEQFLSASNVKVQSIKGIQRYPLTNHLHWLSKNKPGGHIKWSFLNNPDLLNAYESSLAANDLTDTIFAYCIKQG